jgi:hypothetical protein
MLGSGRALMSVVFVGPDAVRRQLSINLMAEGQPPTPLVGAGGLTLIEIPKRGPGRYTIVVRNGSAEQADVQLVMYAQR